MASATREGREERDFARAGERHVERRRALVDGGAERRAFGQRLGMAGAAVRSHVTRSPTVAMSVGGLTSSSGTPTVRFIQAK